MGFVSVLIVVYFLSPVWSRVSGCLMCNVSCVISIRRPSGLRETPRTRPLNSTQHTHRPVPDFCSLSLFTCQENEQRHTTHLSRFLSPNGKEKNKLFHTISSHNNNEAELAQELAASSGLVLRGTRRTAERWERSDGERWGSGSEMFSKWTQLRRPAETEQCACFDSKH